MGQLDYADVCSSRLCYHMPSTCRCPPSAWRRVFDADRKAVLRKRQSQEQGPKTLSAAECACGMREDTATRAELCVVILDSAQVVLTRLHTDTPLATCANPLQLPCIGGRSLVTSPRPWGWRGRSKRLGHEAALLRLPAHEDSMLRWRP